MVSNMGRIEGFSPRGDGNN